METQQYDSDYHFRARDILLGTQMLFVALGALVLVPLLTGLNPDVALFTAGAGTLLFQVVTKGKVPIFLASSFAFIAPIIYGVQTWGIAGTMCGLLAAGVFYVLLSVLIYFQGGEILHTLLPPIVTGPVIMVIGLILAPVAVFMATGMTGDGSSELVPRNTALVVSFTSLVVTLAVSLLGRGLFKLIPILCGIIAGYLISIPFGLIDLAPVREAAWFALPSFTFPSWNLEAIFFIVPVAIAPAIEHFGDILAIGSVTKKDYIKDPGIHRTMLGDGLATSLAALFGGPPNTTYSEVTGAVTLTKTFNPAIMTWAAMIAIILAFVGKVGAMLQTIPSPVMGGIMLLLFGAITVVGLNTVCSDNPVALAWSLRPTSQDVLWRAPGFGLKNTEVTVPLTRNMALRGSFEQAGGVWPVQRRIVAAFNSRTVGNANKYIYCPQIDFELVWHDSVISFQEFLKTGDSKRKNE